MKTWTSWLAAVAGGIVIGFFTARAADDPGSLPESLARLITALHPDADVVSVEPDREDGALDYEIVLRQRVGGRLVDIEAREGIGIMEMDEEIAADALPAPVRRTLEATFPRAVVQKVVKAAETKHHFEVELLVAGRRHEVTFSTRGKILEVDRKD